MRGLEKESGCKLQLEELASDGSFNVRVTGPNRMVVLKGKEVIKNFVNKIMEEGSGKRRMDGVVGDDNDRRASNDAHGSRRDGGDGDLRSADVDNHGGGWDESWRSWAGSSVGNSNPESRGLGPGGPCDSMLGSGPRGEVGSVLRGELGGSPRREPGSGIRGDSLLGPYGNYGDRGYSYDKGSPGRRAGCYAGPYSGHEGEGSWRKPERPPQTLEELEQLFLQETIDLTRTPNVEEETEIARHREETFRIREISKWFATANLQAAAVPRALEVCRHMAHNQSMLRGPQVPHQLLKSPQLVCVRRVPQSLLGSQNGAQGPQNGSQGPQRGPKTLLEYVTLHQFAQLTKVRDADSAASRSAELSRGWGDPAPNRNTLDSQKDKQGERLGGEKESVEERSKETDVEEPCVKDLKTDTAKLNLCEEKVQGAGTGETCISIEDRSGDAAGDGLVAECDMRTGGSQNGTVEPANEDSNVAIDTAAVRSCVATARVRILNGHDQAKPTAVEADPNTRRECGWNDLMPPSEYLVCHNGNCVSVGKPQQGSPPNGANNTPVQSTNFKKPTKGKRTHLMMGKSIAIQQAKASLRLRDLGLQAEARKDCAVPPSSSENGNRHEHEASSSDCEIEHDRMTSQICPGTGRNGIRKKRRMVTNQKLVPPALDGNHSLDLCRNREKQSDSAKLNGKVEPEICRRPKRERSAPYWLAQFHHVEVPGAVTPAFPKDEVKKTPSTSHIAPVITRPRNGSGSDKVCSIVGSWKQGMTAKQASRKGRFDTDEKVGAELANEHEDCRIGGKTTVDMSRSPLQPVETMQRNGQLEGGSTSSEEKDKQMEKEKERGVKHPSKADGKDKPDGGSREGIGPKAGKTSRQKKGGNGKPAGPGLSVACPRRETSPVGHENEDSPKAVCLARVTSSCEFAEAQLNSQSPSSSMSPVHVKEWERLADWEQLPSPAVSPRAARLIMSPFSLSGRSPSPTRTRSRSVSRSRSRSSSPSPSLLPSLAAAVLTTQTHGRGRTSQPLYAVKHLHSKMKQEMEAKAKARLAKANPRGCPVQMAALTPDDPMLTTVDSQQEVVDNPTEEVAMVHDHYPDVQPTTLPIPAFRPVLRQKQTPRGGKGTDRLKVHDEARPAVAASPTVRVVQQVEEQDPTVLHLFPTVQEMQRQNMNGGDAMRAQLMGGQASAGVENVEVEEEERSGLEVCSDTCSRDALGSWERVGLYGQTKEGTPNIETKEMEGRIQQAEHDDRDECDDQGNDKVRPADESRANVRRLRYATFKGCMCCEYAYWDKRKCRRIAGKDNRP
ncbi:hypothetical protein CBR_g39750 [Chara braunii]|uniref:Uncharacterized protein n=1 Tax=Chara braunii TaxID=69332 RepID=A0A388LSF9_CHABU|nr:hypothetical protein CBR_g39750 [Chara braunii]|eukprot:GBG85185.1 hypothetical protein CBR_g39750 [Chara braunii]